MKNNFVLSPISLTDFETLIKNCVSSVLQSQTPEPPPQDDELLTTAEATKLLRVSKVTIHKWRKEGRIKFHRINTRIRFKRSELMEALQTSKKYGRGKKNENTDTL